MDRSNDSAKLVLGALPVHPSPALDPATHSLRVTGAVEAPSILAAADLRARPQTTVVRDFDCEEGWTVPGLSWTGIPLAALVTDAGPCPGATWVTLASGDFATTLPLDEVGDALVVLALDGSPLPIEHGGPMRIFVPGGVCFTSIKWLDRIEVTMAPEEDTARHIALRRIGRDSAEPVAS